MRTQIIIFVIVATIFGLCQWKSDLASEVRAAVRECADSMQQGNWQGAAPHLYALPAKTSVLMPQLPAGWLKEIADNGAFGPASRILSAQQSQHLLNISRRRIALHAFAHTSGYIVVAKKCGVWQIVACRHLSEPAVVWPGSETVWCGLEMGKVVVKQSGECRFLAWTELLSGEATESSTPPSKPVVREVVVEHVIPVVDKKPAPVIPETPANETVTEQTEAKAVSKKCIFRFKNGVESETTVPLRATIKDMASGQVSEIGEEMELKPGRYEIELEQEGYKPYRQELDLTDKPGEPTFFHYTFEPLPRQLFWRFRADYPEGEEVQPDTFTINGVSPVSPASIQPGVNLIEVSKDGYAPLREQVVIQAGRAPYFLGKTLLVRERQLSLDILDKETRQPLSPDNITIQGESIANGKAIMLKPGEYEYGVTIAGYLPLTNKVVIPAGSGIYRLPVFINKIAPAVPEKTTATTAARQVMALPSEFFVIDGIDYSYEFSIDDRPLPPEAVTIQRSGEQTTVSLAIPESGKQLRVAAGYLSCDYALPQLPEQLQEFSHIALESWKAHFEKLFRQAGKDATIDALSNFFASDAMVKKMKQSCDPEMLKELVMYIQDWPIPPQLLKQIEDTLTQEKK